jgi:ABC-2 type transport system permease protein
MGLVAFWYLEVSSLVFVYMLISYFLSGHMLPLDWLPDELGGWIRLLPFKYLAFVPAAVLLEKYNSQQMAMELGLGCIWVVILYLLNRLALARGLRRYSAYGG